MAQELGLKNNRRSLKGMTALVTSGTRGIGYAVVEELAAFEVTVHTCSRNQTELDEKLQAWKNKGFNVTGSVCDMLSRPQRESLMTTVSSLFNGKLNILVNNAGTAITKHAEDFTSEDFSTVMGTKYTICRMSRHSYKNAKPNILNAILFYH